LTTAATSASPGWRGREVFVLRSLAGTSPPGRGLATDRRGFLNNIPNRFFLNNIRNRFFFDKIRDQFFLKLVLKEIGFRLRGRCRVGIGDRDIRATARAKRRFPCSVIGSFERFAAIPALNHNCHI